MYLDQPMQYFLEKLASKSPNQEVAASLRLPGRWLPPLSAWLLT